MENLVTDLGIGFGIVGISLLGRHILWSELKKASNRRARESGFDKTKIDFESEIKMRSDDSYAFNKMLPRLFGIALVVGAGIEIMQNKDDLAIGLLVAGIVHLLEPNIRKLSGKRFK